MKGESKKKKRAESSRETSSSWSAGSAYQSSGSSSSSIVADQESLAAVSDAGSPSLESLLSKSSTSSIEEDDELPPSALPPGWSMRYTADGKPYFVDVVARKTTWLDPRTNRPAVWGTQQLPGARPLTNHKKLINEWSLPLPEGWEMGLSANSVPYFIDHKNHKTTWIDPRSVLFRDSSREGHEQRMKIKQLKNANEELQSQIGLISQQQKQLEHEVLQSATPETLALAKMKAMADAQRLLEQQYRDAHTRNRDMKMAMQRQKMHFYSDAADILGGVDPRTRLGMAGVSGHAHAHAARAAKYHTRDAASASLQHMSREERDLFDSTPPAIQPNPGHLRSHSPSVMGLPSPTHDHDLPITPTDFSDVLERMAVADSHLGSPAYPSSHLDDHRAKDHDDALHFNDPLTDLLPYAEAPSSPSSGFGKQIGGPLHGADPLLSTEAFDQYLGSWCV